jgi:hypothetical protein
MSSGKKPEDMRSEYRLAKLGKGTRGKYFKRYEHGNNVVAIDPDRPKRSRASKR